MFRNDEVAAQSLGTRDLWTFYEFIIIESAQRVFAQRFGVMPAGLKPASSVFPDSPVKPGNGGF
jgi:hypothetical protein